MKFIHSQHCRVSQGGPCYCVTDRGYRVQQEIKPGTLVTIYDEMKVERNGETVMLPGMVAKLEDFTNMGFGGIVATITVNGKRVHHVPAGKLRVADNGESARKAIREELDRRMAVARQALTDALEWAAEHGIPEDEVVERVGRTRA